MPSLVMKTLMRKKNNNCWNENMVTIKYALMYAFLILIFDSRDLC